MDNIKLKCKIDGCKRKIAIKKHGLCRAHVARYYKWGTCSTEIPVMKYGKKQPYDLNKDK
jgi:hypothetical protein